MTKKLNKNKQSKNTEIPYDFIATSKVVRIMFDPATADILAVLIYKHKYWEEEGKLEPYKGKIGFYISYSDIKEETGFSENIIKKRIKQLKKAGLIETAQQGLGKPNYYYLDINYIHEYIKDNEPAYEKWRLDVRNENAVPSVENSKKVESYLSGSEENDFQEYQNSPTTKNKNTKNKITNNLTNPINGVIEEDDLYDKQSELEDLIEKLKSIENAYPIEEEDYRQCINQIYDCLKAIVPKFKGFTMSEEDSKLIENMGRTSLYSPHMAGKITTNAKKIIRGDMESRFGSLLVGVSNMIHENEVRYS
ncbi:winged helix-turn-helix domain-containing protein [Formosa sp. PL04]|uniref:winged helix-turn-helix domain-containing protein n=1 Tax=Formosa sp. PL04 TaxID=3081755 RepID=UPI002982438C|nr:winged helix-turn-helix domain-containing protein [Formosa sp. PL04]MDW5289450.1 winged helix-turn-helix domain-containing protein [Formosa sp. PL04]